MDNRPQPKQGSNSCKSLKLSRLAAQVSEQECLAATTTPLACSLGSQEQRHPALSIPTQEDQLQGGALHSLSTAQGTPSCDGAQVKSTLFSNFATLCQDDLTCASFVDSVSGLTEVTPAGTLASDHPLALNLSNYLVIPHNQLPANEQDDTAHGTSMFLMFHRIACGNKGHFWFLQVGIKYLEDQDSKTAMLLGLVSLMDTLPNAINGFAVHPLDKSSSFPPLTSNKLEDGFPGSAFPAFKHFVVKDKRNRQFNQQTAAPLHQTSPHKHNNEDVFKPPTSLWGVIHVTGKGNVKEACEALAWDMEDTCLQVQ
jgi:hypothetical protein